MARNHFKEKAEKKQQNMVVKEKEKLKDNNFLGILNDSKPGKVLINFFTKIIK